MKTIKDPGMFAALALAVVGAACQAQADLGTLAGSPNTSAGNDGATPSIDGGTSPSTFDGAPVDGSGPIDENHPSPLSDSGPIDENNPLLPPSDDGGGLVRVTGTCDQAEQGLVNRFHNAGEVNAVLIGRWQHCSGIPLSTATDEAGIEFASDGTWYALVQSDSGALVRAMGFSHQGTWLVSESAVSSSAYPFIQLNIYQAQGGDGCGYPAFSVTPTKLDCDTSAAGPHIYVAIP